MKSMRSRRAWSVTRIPLRRWRVDQNRCGGSHRQRTAHVKSSGVITGLFVNDLTEIHGIRATEPISLLLIIEPCRSLPIAKDGAFPLP